MTKKMLFLTVILALLLSVLPATAFAAKPAEVRVDVRNQTGGVVSLDFADASGNHIYKSVEEGVSSFTLTEGLYNYYASTVCGNQAGQLNLGVTKTLYIVCNEGAPVLQATKGCVQYLHGIWSGDNGPSYTNFAEFWQNNQTDIEAEFGDKEFFKFFVKIFGMWDCRNTVLPSDMYGTVGQNQ